MYEYAHLFLSLFSLYSSSTHHCYICISPPPLIFLYLTITPQFLLSPLLQFIFHFNITLSYMSLPVVFSQQFFTTIFSWYCCISYTISPLFVPSLYLSLYAIPSLSLSLPLCSLRPPPPPPRGGGGGGEGTDDSAL